MLANKTSLKVLTSEDEPEPHRSFWAELRVSKGIQARSHHSAVVYNGRMWVYGGYEPNTGILSDFSSMNLHGEGGFEFVEESRNGAYPGPLHRHSAVKSLSLMLIFGGKHSIFENSNRLFRFSFEDNLWEVVEPEGGVSPPSLDSHNAVMNPENEDEMIVFGGFMGGKIGRYSRSIFSYRAKENSWSVIYDGFSKAAKDEKRPKKRSNAGMAIIKGGIYVFGGANSKAKLDDFWRFDLDTRKWTSLESEGDRPLARCGHLCLPFKNSLIIFGGIHDIAHEKNDLFSYDLDSKEWLKLDSDFTESLQIPEKLIYKANEKQVLQNKVKIPNPTKTTPKSNNMPMKKVPLLTPKGMKANVKIPRKGSRSKSPRNKKTSIMMTHPMEQPKSPGQIREERLRQQFLEKKHQLLAEFEIDDEEKRRQLVNSPTTETMKKSISSLNLNSSKGTTQAHERKEGGSPINTLNNNISLGFSLKERKPCARDGFSSVLFSSRLIIFGGDRHNMTFKDCYVLDLEKLF